MPTTFTRMAARKVTHRMAWCHRVRSEYICVWCSTTGIPPPRQGCGRSLPRPWSPGRCGPCECEAVGTFGPTSGRCGHSWWRSLFHYTSDRDPRSKCLKSKYSYRNPIHRVSKGTTKSTDGNLQHQKKKNFNHFKNPVSAINCLYCHPQDQPCHVAKKKCQQNLHNFSLRDKHQVFSKSRRFPAKWAWQINIQLRYPSYYIKTLPKTPFVCWNIRIPLDI